MNVMEVRLLSPHGTLDTIEGAEAVALRCLLPTLDDSGYVILRYIDPYDDTVFTSFQMTPLLEELNRLIGQYSEATDLKALEHLRLLALAHKQNEAADLKVLERLRVMALACSQQVGRHLKFMGD